MIVDLPAGYDSDDEYISEEDEKEDNIFVPNQSQRLQGVQPPPTRPGVSKQGLHPPPVRPDVLKQTPVNDSTKSSVTTGFQWTRNTGAMRAPGTDPAKLRKEFISASSSGNVDGKARSDDFDDSAPFGVPRRRRAKAQADTADLTWVEQVLKLKSQESKAPLGSLEV